MKEVYGNNVLGILWTLCLIFFCWAVALVIKHKKPVSDFRREFARKFVHIGVSNWYFIYCSFFTLWIYPVAGLLFFALVNYFIEIKTGTRRSLGTVYYPIVIIMMIAMKEFGFGSVKSIGCGLLGMGYADGLAALVGKKFGRIKMPFTEKKSVIGSSVVMSVTVIIVSSVGGLSLMPAFLIGFSAMLAEAYTVSGLDNFTVPLIIYVLSAILC